MKTAQSDLVYSIKNNNLSIKIDMLLTQEDYDANWKGENGSDGYWTDNVTKIYDTVSSFANDEFGLDLQIWEEGNAFVQNLNPKKLNEIVEALEKAFDEKFDIRER